MKKQIPFLVLCAGVLFLLSSQKPVLSQPPTIDQIRKGSLLIKGEPGTSIKVEQVKHEFWFGCAISSRVFSEHTRMAESDIQVYKQKFLENFNSAVTENAVKWGAMERNQGVIDYKTPDRILDWTEANGLPCRGHNLYWGVEYGHFGGIK